MTEASRRWAVTKVFGYNAFIVNGVALNAPKTGPLGFMPVFKTKAEAMAYADNDESLVLVFRTENP
jgi:hypothetical protein